MEMKKNVFALALCAVLSLSLLSACGGKESATILSLIHI